jgi:hypothetical protein
MKFFKQHKIIFGLIIVGVVLAFVLPIIMVKAKTTGVDEVINGLNSISEFSDLPDKGSPANLTTRVGTYINYLLQGLGALFLGLAIFAGVQWMLARDNEEAVTKSKDLLRDASVGLAIVLVAFLLTKFVLTSAIEAITGPMVSQPNTSDITEVIFCKVSSNDSAIPDKWYDGVCKETCDNKSERAIGISQCTPNSIKKLCCVSN